MSGPAQDLRYALRQLRKNPGFSLAAIITLALGIGANTAIFSLLNAVMLQSIPVRHPEQLVILRWSAHSRPENLDTSSYADCLWVPGAVQSCSFSYPIYKALAAHAGSFASVLAMAGAGQLDLSGNGATSMVDGELVSGNYFETLGVSSALGRTIEPSDDRPDALPIVVLSYAYWQRAFGGADVIGRVVRLNSSPFTISGVIDPQFTRLTPGKSHDLWIPLSQAASLEPASNNRHSRADNPTDWWLAIIARLKPQVSLGETQAEANLVFRDEVLHGANPVFKDADDPRVEILPAQKGLVGFRQFYDEPIYILSAAVGTVLVIVCANLAALLLARATRREREIAVRLALGARRSQIIQQLLTETLLLSFAGAALGVLFADWSARAMAAYISRNAYSTLFIDTRPDARVLAFAVVIALLTGILFGLAPAFRGSRISVGPALKESSGGSAGAATATGRRIGLGSCLVVAQVALSVVVLVGAGLLVRTLSNLRKVNPGFDTQNVLLFGINPILAGYKVERIQTLYGELQARLASVPGVISASYSSGTLLSDGLWTSGVHIEGQPEKATVETDMLAVGPEFFETMRLPLVSGRTFSQPDLQSERAIAVVNRAFVRRFLGGKNPIGVHLGGTTPSGKKVEREIVGIVGDAKYENLRKSIEPTAYIPLQVSAGGSTAYFAIRTSTRSEALIPKVRQVVAGVDDNLPLFDVRTQTETIDRLLFNERLVAQFSSLFGALALILACVGLYGLLSYEVARRTREIGIRTALGAQRREIFRLVLRQGLTLTILGVIVGIALAIGVTRYLGSLLYGVAATDPLTFVTIAFTLVAVAILACYIPSRRATSIDPIVALRYE